MTSIGRSQSHPKRVLGLLLIGTVKLSEDELLDYQHSHLNRQNSEHAALYE